MHFANQNLLYQVHQALGTQHVTVAFFKRYARCPETRTFKNYFRPSRANSWARPGHLFIPYLRKRPACSLSRYIALHKRKRDPILTNFARLKTTLLEKLQHLKTHLAPPNPHASHLKTLKTQNKPNFQAQQIAVSNLSTTDYRSRVTDNGTKNKPKLAARPSRSHVQIIAGVPPAFPLQAEA